MASDARHRMNRAAVELFGEFGYSETSVDQIAARAGVTQRTFFRHFGDKGEVLFTDDDELLGVLVTEVRGAPPDEPLLVTGRRALGALADVLHPLREELRIRAALILDEPPLRERELLKLDRWLQSLVALLGERGVPRGRAVLATAVINACWTAAYQPWVSDRSRTSLRRRVDDAFVALEALTGESAGTSPPADLTRSPR